MNTIVLLVNSAACVAIFWVCGTFLIVGDRVDCWRRALMQGGLLLSMTGAFAAGMAPFAGHSVPTWWTLLLRIGIATLALLQFDQAFGLAEQGRVVARRVRAWPLRLHVWWEQRWAIAERYARRREP